MSEPLTPVPSEPPAAAQAASAGAMLRAARERQGLHIAALAAAIKVSPRKLDALENDRWSELPDATFTRALAQTVCRTLKVDARPVLDKLPAPAAVALEAADAGLNAPFRERPGRDEPGLAAAAIKPMVWGAAVLMAAAVAVFFLPPGLFGGGATPPVASGVQPAPPPAALAPVAPAASGAPSALAASAASAPEAAASVAVAATASAPAVGGETVFSAPPATEPAASAAVPVAAAAAVAGLVQLRVNEASWMEVRDGRGTVLLSRTVLPGEAVGLDGVRPFSLVIGNATATQLVYRGQPIDLSPRTRDNVARFELP
jgi:cytoskeleton protein RodZ